MEYYNRNLKIVCNMITEDYVSFETAKLLQEKGFNEDFNKSYSQNGTLISNFTETCIPAPTLYVVMKWLRSVYDINIQVMLDSWSAAYGSMGYYIVLNQKNGELEDISPILDINSDDNVFFDTYEEAAEKAIDYVVKNLLK